MSLRFKIALLRALGAAIVSASFLCACHTGAVRPGTPAPPPVQQPGRPPGGVVPGHEGRPYNVVSGESLLTILVFRGGTLAKAGHNHVVAAHDLSGAVYVPSEVLHSSFELRFAVAQLSVDEPELRAKAGADFPGEVPDSARDGTRHNMLGEALLDAAQFPEITLASEGLEGEDGAQGSRAAGGEAQVQAHVKVIVRGQEHSLTVPVRYRLQNDRITADGELPIKQSELGLKPFTAMLGALQVQDEMRVKFHVVAQLAAVRGRSGS